MANDHDKFTCGCSKCERAYREYYNSDRLLSEKEILKKVIATRKGSGYDASYSKLVKKILENKPKKQIYEIEVHNPQGSATYLTENPDVTSNYIRGNEPMIRFVTIEGDIVSLPNNVIITQRELK